MTIDFKKDPVVIVVHGVQTGTNATLTQGKLMRKLIQSVLDDSSIDKSFEVRLFPYEDINDNAQKVAQMISKALTANSPIAETVLSKIIDAVGDVVSAALQTNTAKIVRDKLREKILEAYEEQKPTVIAAHSLGTVYSLDVVNELMSHQSYFKGDDLKTWPALGLVTFGSPLGLKLFSERKIAKLEGAQYSRFPWVNFWNKLDPVVSGNLFGAPETTTGNFKGPVEKRYSEACTAGSWDMQPEIVKSGKQWVAAHRAYWDHPRIGEKIVQILWD